MAGGIEKNVHFQRKANHVSETVGDIAKVTINH